MPDLNRDLFTRQYTVETVRSDNSSTVQTCTNTTYSSDHDRDKVVNDTNLISSYFKDQRVKQKEFVFTQRKQTTNANKQNILNSRESQRIATISVARIKLARQKRSGESLLHNREITVKERSLLDKNEVVKAYYKTNRKTVRE
ncbi:hypothetical protein MAR_021402 [Mya arenaria]|uniref:Uncharacterized protein n=1 Tax=Mya arenaria TaxID=6604 RepID=A0ABY7E7J7_MYAAR|nr:hypothetical protein MAR_021402 [Mya arenaria]